MLRAAAPVAPIHLSHRARLLIVSAVLMGLFLSALDQTIVGTALPTIVTDLGGNSLYVWVVTAYLLTSTVTVPMYGKLSDLFGRRPLLLIGISIFLVGSALSGLSQNMAELIFFRGVQGLGAGALFPIALAVVGDLFSPRERGRYQGLFGAVFGLSFLVGPFLGGYITDNINWHWVFYVNVPIGLVALLVIAVVLPNTRQPNASSNLDYLGALTFVAGVVPLLIGLTMKGVTDSHGQLYGWLDWRVGGLIALAAVILGLFLLVEARAKEPILPLDLFRSATYSAIQVATFFISFGFFAAVILLPRYYQAVEGISATSSGYMIWPLLVGLIGTSIGAGQLVSHTGRYKRLLIVSAVLLGLGMFLMTHLTAHTGDVPLWAWMLVVGLGVGPSMSVYTVVVQNAVPMNRLGVATSSLTFFRQVGGTVGLAIAGTMVSSSFATRLPGQLVRAGVPRAVVDHLPRANSSRLTGVGNLAAELRHTLPAPLRGLAGVMAQGIHDALGLAIAQTFWLGVIAGGVALAAVVVMRELPLRTTFDSHQPASLAPAAAVAAATPERAVPEEVA
ncbi:MAG TPA: MDR family MFS transporter [Candidatus Dormibacteraeota bacterium]|nr:MDR family MFS transporter [Candidatus Dormibacteraeota bacterium]